MMSLYARIQTGQVVETVDIDQDVHAAWVGAGNPKAQAYRIIADDPSPSYDPTAETLVESFVVEPDRVRRAWTVRQKTADELRKIWTSYEFLRRFTVDERAAIRTASASDGAVADLLMFLQTATEVVSDDLTTSVGLDYLVHLGILTEARKAELLSP